MKIIANIGKVETDTGDRPVDDVRIVKARVVEDQCGVYWQPLAE